MSSKIIHTKSAEIVRKEHHWRRITISKHSRERFNIKTKETQKKNCENTTKSYEKCSNHTSTVVNTRNGDVSFIANVLGVVSVPESCTCVIPNLIFPFSFLDTHVDWRNKFPILQRTSANKMIISRMTYSTVRINALDDKRIYCWGEKLQTHNWRYDDEDQPKNQNPNVQRA